MTRLFYNNRLIHAPATANRELSVRMTEFNAGTYGIAHPFVLVDVNSQADIHNTSRYNLINASVGLNLTARLLDLFEPGNLAIICPYRAQYEVYRRRIRQMETMMGKDFRAVQLDTIDGFQGKEAVIVVLDLVVTDNLGFTHELNRLNAALSRARNGSIIITNVMATGRRRTRRPDGSSRLSVSTKEREPTTTDASHPFPHTLTTAT